MKRKMLHIYQNTPLGRERLMQSAYFCSTQSGLNLVVYVPSTPQFSMTLARSLMHIQLDQTYVVFPATAREHVDGVLSDFDCDYEFQEPLHNYRGQIPPLPADWTFMTCPRVISGRPPRSGLASLGPKVRGLAKTAPFPLFIPSAIFKPWSCVTAFFGGSRLGAMAIRQAMSLCEATGMPLRIHTHLNGTSREECENVLRAENLLQEVENCGAHWRMHERGSFEEKLFDIPSDSLVVIGAAGDRSIKNLVLGSKLELVQSSLPNPLVVVGPQCGLAGHGHVRTRNSA